MPQTLNTKLVGVNPAAGVDANAVASPRMIKVRSSRQGPDVDPAAPSFQELLKKKMAEKRLRQLDLAKALGRHESTISLWLSGRNAPRSLDAKTERLLARFLNLSVDRLRASLDSSSLPSVSEMSRDVVGRLDDLNTLFKRRPTLKRLLGPLGALIDFDAAQRAFVSEGVEVSVDTLRDFVTKRDAVPDSTTSSGLAKKDLSEKALAIFQREFRRDGGIRDGLRAAVKRLNTEFEAAAETLPMGVVGGCIADAVPHLQGDFRDNVVSALVDHLRQVRLVSLIERGSTRYLQRRWQISPEYVINTLFGISTGIEGLDFLLDGGLLPPPTTGSAALVRGLPGAGKTVLSLQIATSFAQQGGVAVYLSAEEDPNLLVERLSFFGYTIKREAGGMSAIPEAKPFKPPVPITIRSLTGIENAGVGEEELKRPHTLVLLSVSARPVKGEGSIFEAVERLLNSISDEGKGYACLVVDSAEALIERRSRKSYDRLFEISRKPMIFGFYLSEDDTRDRLNVQDYVADTVITLGYRRPADISFVERIVEIRKCRTQHHVRGEHTFAIRSGEGIVVFPTVQAKLSVWRTRVRLDMPAPPIDWKLDPQFDMNRILRGDVVEGSSVLLVGPPATHKFPIALSFLASEFSGHTLLISLREDPTAALRILAAYPQMSSLVARNGDLAVLSERLSMLYFAPDYFTAAVFIEGVERFLRKLRRQGKPVKRVLFNNLNQLSYNSPMFGQEKLFIPALIELFRKDRLTSLFIQVSDKDTEVENIFDAILRLDPLPSPNEVQLRVSHSWPFNADRRPSIVRRRPDGSGRTLLEIHQRDHKDQT
jgi:KaiC/GvpD/RAD55 family RecA-like ATPase/transcriptional regulator with XRE-family HTH domain